jgi:acetolactate synthase-1/2/3 large subunit
MPTGAEILIEGLIGQGVTHLFGMPGSHSTAIYDALVRAGKITSILIRNEQAGAFAADGFARVTGKPGVVCTTAGPGATNALTGVAECWADSVPILLLSGQVNTPDLDRECGNYHEIDLEGIFRPVTNWCGTPRRLEQIPNMIARAFQAMTWDRPRPAALFLPQDLMRAEGTIKANQAELPPRPEPKVPTESIDRAVQILASAQRPIILAGGGALWSGAASVIGKLAERLSAPLITTLNGKGLIDECDTVSLGHARSARARLVLPEADAMLAIGCRFTEVLTNWRRMPVPRNLIQIDLDPQQIGMNYPLEVGILADARAACQAMLDALDASSITPSSNWGDLLESARAAKPSKPEWLIDTLRDCLPPEVPVFTDACEMGYRMHSDWLARGPRRFFYPSNFITLGWAYPAAVGAAVALQQSGIPVVSLSGDGGFTMTSQELATAARYGLRTIALVHNDSTFGAIKNIQDRVFEGRYRDVELNNPDFIALASAYGVPARRAVDPDELRSAVREALDRDGPSLIEIPDRWRFLRDLAVPSR